MLRASRPPAPAASQGAAAVAEPEQQTPPAAPAPRQAAPATPTARQAPPASPVPSPQQSTAVGAPGRPSVADLNAGVFENMEGMGEMGNYVSLDGSVFLYKATENTVDYLDIIPVYVKRFYQWVDEANPQAKVFHNSDTKLDERYKLKIEVRWQEDGEEEGDEPVEYTMSLSTTSSIQFGRYVQKLSKSGLGVSHVWTRCTISRHLRQNSKTERYSRVDFEALSLESGEPLGITSA